MDKLRAYYQLTKPGVTYGNALTAVAGFLLASQGQISWPNFLGLTFGITFIIAAACALNNHLDRDIDSKMARTKSRPSVTGQVNTKEAISEVVILLLTALVLLIIFTNLLAVIAAVLGFLIYVWPYGAWTKRRSVHGTLVGAVSGAMPILAGYLAVSGQLDIGAGLVFLVLFFWQMPEFYSIAIYRRQEYKAAGVPVISVVHGVKRTKIEIFIYTLAFVISSLALSLVGVTGGVYLLLMSLLGVYWLWLAVQGLKTAAADKWARQMFGFSLVMLLSFSFLISIDSWLI